MIAVIFFLVAATIHFAAFWMGAPIDSPYFVGSGFCFLMVTLFTHGIISRDDGGKPLVSLLFAMVTRLMGTFAILALLLFLSPLGRQEAVFNVLFWYITLTSIDLVVIVRQRADRSPGPIRQVKTSA